MINKDMFYYNLRNKNYLFCIDILTKEIKNDLIKKINLRQPHFKYTNMENLKYNCFKFLDDVEKETSQVLYDFSQNEFPNTFELSVLLDIYKELKI